MSHQTARLEAALAGRDRPERKLGEKDTAAVNDLHVAFQAGLHGSAVSARGCEAEEGRDD